MAHIYFREKKLFYSWGGAGQDVLLLLHGNTASSYMFREVIPLYEKHFRVLLVDFLGHGQSERLREFSADLWFDQAVQVSALLDALELSRINILGTSGGALVALNIALERPGLVHRVIADSFEGESALDAVALEIEGERLLSKQEAGAIRFWQNCHGADWESVVDNDTQAILSHHATIKKFFHRELEDLAVPALLTASLKDEFAEIARFPETYAEMLKKIPEGSMHLFATGGHPACLSSAAEFAELAKNFFLQP